MEKFSSNLLLRYSYTPRRKYVNNEEELTGEERKILNFSLFLLRAPLRLWKCSSTCCPCLSAWEGQNCFLGFKGLSSLLAVQLLSLSLVPCSFVVSLRVSFLCCLYQDSCRTPSVMDAFLPFISLGFSLAH